MNKEKKVIKTWDIVKNQIPEFIVDENQNFSEFLKQYYISQEYTGGNIDLIENLPEYKNVDSFDKENLITSTTLTADLDGFSEEIEVDSTKGWPESYGLLKINGEIITYTSKTETSFLGCIRGFSAIESLSNENENLPESLIFTETSAEDHLDGDSVKNLSNLFLLEFFKNIKYQFAPGFEEVDLNEKINPQNFISRVRTFYQTKGTDEAFKILFKVLYDENVEILKPINFCFTLSDDKWVITETFVCDLVSGDPLKIKGQTLYQNEDVGNPNVLPASGSIYEIESFAIKGKTLYKVKIFSGYSNNANPKGSITGTFVPTPKTFCVENAVGPQDSLFVDSTIGFPQQGIIKIGDVELSYTDKTNDQFLNVSGLGVDVTISRASEVFGTNFVYSYEDGDETKLVVLKINNVLADIQTEELNYALDGDPIKVNNIGNTSNDTFVKSLRYNHPITIPAGIATDFITPTVRQYFKEGFSVVNGLALSKFDHKLRSNDTVNLFAKTSGQFNLVRPNLSVNTNLSKEFTVQQVADDNILGKEVLFRRNLKKTKATPFTKYYNNIQDKFIANIQDSYSDFDNYYITSNGLPDYEINPYIREFTLVKNNGFNFTGDHNFYDGESVKVVSYKPSLGFENNVGIDTGVTYFVKRISSNSLSLYLTRDNVGISTVNFFEYTNNILSGTLDEITLIASPLFGNNFTSSKLFKKFPKILNFSKEKVKTQPGPIGIFINGVEIQSYKSFDRIYYGEIEDVTVLNGGEDYSLVTPPRFQIFDGNFEDTKTSLIPEMEGELKGFIVENPGFDYEDIPQINISGGGNDEVPTEVKMKFIDKELFFNATTKDTVVNTVQNELRFGKSHGFVTGEAVVYETFGTFPIGIGTDVNGGTLLNNSIYYTVNIGAGTSIKLAKNKSDALSGTNLIDIRTTGGGIQKFRSLTRVQVVDEVNFIGSNLKFKYKKLSFGPDDINIYDNIFNCTDHQFENGEEVVITVEGTYLGGANEGQSYYIKKLDANRFQLTTDIIGKNILNITDIDFATTYFVQYPPIRVTVEGKIKEISSGSIGYGATVIPIVEGNIKSIRVQRGLARPSEKFLGAKNTINYHRKPFITVLEGMDAAFQPIVEDGKIIEVVVKNAGEDYYNNIELQVKGNGFGAVLLPVISNGEIYNGQISYGQIIDVLISDPGVGYASTNTTIEVVSKGKNFKCSANLTSWTLNEVTKLGVSNLSRGCLLGKRYSLFGNVYSTFFADSDILSSFNIPATPVRHSPIIGWAYDGCPIYGPYSFANADGTGSIIRMTSGYSRIKTSPPSILDCIDDYVFTGTGTLDRNNGRFCITPEYPNGIYAYFCTLDNNNVPVFPYVIGDTYEYVPSSENVNLKVNQNINFNTLNITKNTAPYRVEDKDNYYEYFSLVTNKFGKDAEITATSTGRVDSINIVDPGQNYKIGDQILFDSDGLGGTGAYGEISELGGVGVSSIRYTTQTFNDVKLLSINTGILGICTVAHNFSDQSFISISGISTSDLDVLEGTKKIRINVEYPITSIASTLSASATTGLVTGITIKEPLFSFNVDDKFVIQNETFTVIGRDFTNNILNVLRESGNPGYGIGSTVYPLQNRFTFGYTGEVKPPAEDDETYYFNPSESISLGTGTAVGLGNTLAIYPLGYGVSTTQFIQYGGIFLPNNKFKTGDKVIYSTPNSSIVTTEGILDSFSDLFVVKLTKDTIGLVRERKYINNPDFILNYTALGTGILHKIKTDKEVPTCSVTQTIVKVSTAQTHGLSINDQVKLNIVTGVTTTFVVGYSSITKRVIINSNPSAPVSLYRNDTIIFDTSSTTLTGKEFGLYTDIGFSNEYYGNDVSGIEVIKTPTQLKLEISENTPEVLYYNLKNVTTDDEIYPDISLVDYHKISITQSNYNKIGVIGSVTDYNFEFDVLALPERTSYVTDDAQLSYSILNSNVKGSIFDTKVIFGGNNYKKLPQVKQILTNEGTGAGIFADSSSIGKIKNIKILNTESTYPTDQTLRPFSNIFSTLKLKNNFKVVDYEVIFQGSKYLSSPTLKLYNREENKVIDSFSAFAVLKNTSINEIVIIDEGLNLKTTDNEIIVLNNTNGMKILDATVSGSGPYEVTLRLETPLIGFTTEAPLPISIGDEIFVENIVSSTGTGFNSKDYSYSPFKVTFVDPAFGSQDAALVRYEVSTFPGVFDIDDTYNAIVINYNDIAKIKPILGQSNFFNDEFLTDGNQILNNQKNFPINQVVKTYNSTGLNVNDNITGKTSQSQGTIYEIVNKPSLLLTGSSVPETIGAQGFRGNLSTILQKVSDNNYYQRFAYSLKSRIPYEDWNSVVADTAHITGYKRFGDLNVESIGIGQTLNVTSDSASRINIVLTSETKVDTIANYDLVIEEDIDNSDGEYSEFIKCNTKKLSDFILSQENRVLSVDDISGLFDTDNSPFVQVQLDEIDSADSVALKYFFFIGATQSFFGDFVKPEIFDAFLTRDNNIINISSYGYYYDFFTGSGSVGLPLGEITAQVSPTNNDKIVINFTPRNIFNSYAIRAIKETAKTAPGITTTSFGYVTNVEKTGIYTGTPSPTTDTFYSIGISSCRGGSVFIGISSTPKRVENALELSFNKDSSGNINYNIFAEQNYDDLGTFEIATSGSDINFNFTPTAGIGVTLFTNLNLITNTFTSPNQFTRELSLFISDEVVDTTSSQVAISTVSSLYASTKYILEATKTVGVSTVSSLVQINSVHFEDYSNNTVYGIVGDFPENELNFETIFNPVTSEYILTFNPSESATYRFRYLQKSILSPNQ
jgi:hypothetical protein